MPSDCLFCKVAAQEVPADVVLATDRVVAFRDLNPQAPTHLLVIPREHLADVRELARRPEVAAAVLAAVDECAAKLGLTGFRTVFNTGAEGGQHVYHVHAHVLAGRQMQWPPG